MNIRTRAMQKKDAPVVAKMTRKLAEFHGDKSTATAKIFIRHCMGRNKIGNVIVATDGDKAIGFIMWHNEIDFISGRKTRSIDLFYVKERFRNKGVGRILFLALADDAIKNKIKQISVSAKKSNKTSNRFYKQIGFIKKQDNKINYKIEDKIFSKLLAN